MRGVLNIDIVKQQSKCGLNIHYKRDFGGAMIRFAVNEAGGAKYAVITGVHLINIAQPDQCANYFR